MSQNAIFRRRSFERDFLIPQMSRFVGAGAADRPPPKDGPGLPDEHRWAEGRTLNALRQFESIQLVELIGWLRIGLEVGYFDGRAPEDGDLVYTYDTTTDKTTISWGDIYRGSKLPGGGLLKPPNIHIGGGRLSEGRMPLVSAELEATVEGLNAFERALRDQGQSRADSSSSASVDVPQFEDEFDAALDDISDPWRRGYLWALWPNSNWWDAYVSPLEEVISVASGFPGATIDPDLLWAVDDRLRGRDSLLESTMTPSLWRTPDGIALWADGRQEEFDQLVFTLNEQLAVASRPQARPDRSRPSRTRTDRQSPGGQRRRDDGAR